MRRDGLLLRILVVKSVLRRGYPSDPKIALVFHLEVDTIDSGQMFPLPGRQQVFTDKSSGHRQVGRNNASRGAAPCLAHPQTSTCKGISIAACRASVPIARSGSAVRVGPAALMGLPSPTVLRGFARLGSLTTFQRGAQPGTDLNPDGFDSVFGEPLHSAGPVVSLFKLKPKVRTQMAALNSMKPAHDHVWLSHGTQQFEHEGILVHPAAVAFDIQRYQLMVVVRAVSSDPSKKAMIDVPLARITAFVVAGSLMQSMPRFSVALYLRYADNTDVAVDARLAETAQLISRRREQVQRRTRSSHSPHPELILGQVLAYVLTTTDEFEGEDALC